MRENDYQKLMNDIHVPEGLEERTLWAARKQLAEETAPGRLAKRNWKPVLRGAVCAVCALALVLGTVRLNPAQDDIGTGSVQYDEGLEALTCEFGLTAYAADGTEGGNGSLVLGAGDEGTTVLSTTELVPERAQYTNYRFQIQGQSIDTLTLSIDQGGLYRVKAGEGPTVLPKPVVEDYDPDAVYGLWVPPQEWVQGRGDSLLNGAELTVTARFTDGTEQTHTYRLMVQRLLVSENEDGTELLVPALEGSDQTGVSGLYVEPLNSVWFHWPVQGSNTISLSNRYGFRAAPGGQGGTFHAGIDIPAPEGEVILAAADGAVTETGFDAKQGNYLVLDHGNGLTTLYAQCRSVEVEEGDTVKAGEMVAAVGATGMATGPHLHFEVRQDGEAQNPVAYFDSEIRDTLKMG